MINIAVLTYNLINDYCYTVVNGISSFFEDKPDVRLIISPVNIPVAQSNNYDYQYWTSVKILQSQQIDGVIVVANSFTNYIDLDFLSKELEGFIGRPVVSVAAPLNLPLNINTSVSCQLAYEQVVEHLKNKHDCKRIAFFGAGLVDSKESEERFQAFKTALQKNDLEFDPKLVFDGDFTPGGAKTALEKVIKSKADFKEINIDAILCVNDYTAGGCLLLFDELGISVPADVKLFGFDDSDFALLTYPTLSSISQTIPKTGYKAGELIYSLLKKETISDSGVIDCYPVYRQSCGCVDCKSHSYSYYDQNGKFFEINEGKQKRDLDILQRYHKTLYGIYNFLNLMDTGTPMEDVVDLLMPSMEMSDIEALMVCLYDQPQVIYESNDFVVPDIGHIQVAIDRQRKLFVSHPFKQGPILKLKERIAPQNYEVIGGGTYFLHPIYLHDKNYGYIFCKSLSEDYLLASINLKILSEVLVHSYEYSVEKESRRRLMENNSNLAMQTKTDELTQVFNRRGILHYGQQLIDLSVSMGKQGSVFFCDLDGLKTINDTYGHKIGDLAIKTEAQVLKATFRDSDLVGRLSGDEFCVVAPGCSVDVVDVIRKKLISNNEKFSKEAGLPFVLSISIGPIEFNSEASDLQNLLQKADQQLYEEKAIKHQKKNEQN